MRTVAILLFNEIEVLDFAGPFEVFGVADRKADPMRPFHVFTVAERGPVYARNGLSINPTYLFNDHPRADIIIVPGGAVSVQTEPRSARAGRWIILPC